MKKILLLMLLVFLLPGLSLAATQLEFEWSYPDGIADLQGFRFYQGTTQIGEIQSASARKHALEMPTLAPGKMCYSMTAYDLSQETAHSPEYCFDPPPPIPGGLKVTVIVTVNVGG